LKDIGDISDDTWQLTCEVNIHAMFRRAAHEAGSAVTNTTSINSDRPTVLLEYTTTKRPIQNFPAPLRRCLQNGISRECRRAGADQDTVYPLEDSGGCRSELRHARNLATGSTARRAGSSLCHSGEPL
jgi:hypothetical protein